MVTDWPEDYAGPSLQRGSFRADDRRRDRRTHQDRGVSGRRVRAPVRDLRRGRGRRRRHVSLVRRLLRKEVAGVPFLRGHALWLHRGRAVRVGPVRRRSGAVGRAQRSIQHQVAPLPQHRFPDGRLVHPRDHLAGRVQGAALPDGRARRRGAPAAGRHRGDPAGRRDHAGAQVRRHRRQRMDRPLARHGDRPAQGGRLLLLSRVPRAGHRPIASASTRACGKASTRATGGSSRPWPRANTRAPWRSSTPTTRCRCASCGTKAPSRS